MRRSKSASYKDPRAALEEALSSSEAGVGIPPGVTVRVVEEGANELCLVLPQDPSATELSEAQLEAVAGGWKDCEKASNCPQRECSIDLVTCTERGPRCPERQCLVRDIGTGGVGGVSAVQTI